MSTSTSSNLFPFGAKDDFYEVDAGGIYTARVIPGSVNEGVLANDTFSLISAPGVGLSISEEIVETSYGRWTIRPDGSFDYYANGALSKYLLENETGTDELDYIVPEIFKQYGNDIATGTVNMKITGKYDPLEV